MDWWKEKVIYQIYSRSFCDSNGDGIGDFKGITSKLDYLQSLGIGGIWLSPHYPSPFLDCGYDISDYSKVAPEYGRLDDFKEFLHEAHKRHIRIILDLVLNHTSTEHSWFLESSSSLDNPKRDWYIWEENRGTLPNDWQSCFRGPAWTLDEKTNSYYYHFFLKEQPDLNWRNKEVKEAMFEQMKFWLDLGIDGFRLDAISSIYEREDLKNHGRDPEVYLERFDSLKDSLREQQELWAEFMKYQLNQPELHDLLREIRVLVSHYEKNLLLIGEMPNTDFLGKGDDELHMIFNFPLMEEGLGKQSVLDNQRMRLPLHPPGSWPANTLSNHDVSRIRSKYGNNDIHSLEIKRAIFLMMTLKGTPFLYYGEELAMKDKAPQKIDDFKDLKAVNLFHRKIKDGLTRDRALEEAQCDTRDSCRTPMPWNNTVHGGFSPEGIKPWLPIDQENQLGVNVEDESKDINSVLNYYKSIIVFRNDTRALQYGEYREIDSKEKNLLIFERSLHRETFIVLINYGAKDLVLNAYSHTKIKMVFGEEHDLIGHMIKGNALMILKVIV